MADQRGLGKRFIRGYPRRKATLIRRYKRDAVDRAALRQKRPRRHARSWSYKTSADPQQLLEARAFQGVRGSLQERLVYQALIDRNFIPGVDFTFQSSQLGGRMQLGGLVADFLFPVPMVIIQVQSAWHTMTLASEIRDNDQTILLRNLGYTVLELWPNIIEDQAALDWWMERNVMHLWGTSKQKLGQGNAAKWEWLWMSGAEDAARIEKLVKIFRQIRENLTGE